MIERSAFHSISYGLYLVAAKNADGRRVGCAINTLVQVSGDPVTVSIALNKDNATTAAVQQSGRFTATVLAQSATMELIGAFGFRSSLEFDKFADFSSAVDGADIPYVTEHACAVLSVKVGQTVDVGTHLLFVGEVEEARKLSDEAPLTYAYYHEVLRGKTPPKAASFVAGDEPAAETLEGKGVAVAEAVAGEAAAEAALEEAVEAVDAAGGEGAPKRYAWQCTVCGHIEYVDELPDDFECPICGVGKEMFERIEL